MPNSFFGIGGGKSVSLLLRLYAMEKLLLDCMGKFHAVEFHEFCVTRSRPVRNNNYYIDTEFFE